MSNHYVYIANPEAKMVHRGIAEDGGAKGYTTYLNPSCNITAARAAGEEGTEYIEESEATALVLGGYDQCGHCTPGLVGHNAVSGEDEALND